MCLDRKSQELALCRSAEHPGHSRIQESHDCPKHPVWCRGIPLMQPKDAAASEAQHDGPVVMCYQVGDAAKSEEAQPITENRVLLLTLRSAQGRLRCQAYLLTRLHSP